MRHPWMLFLFALAAPMAGRAQQQASVSGVVTDSLNGRPLDRAVISLFRPLHKDTLHCLTDSSGRFRIPLRDTGTYIVSVSFEGYCARSVEGRTGPGLQVQLLPAVKDMETIVIDAPALSVRQDTVEYRSDAYRVRKDAVLEDLLRKLPGVEIDKDGNIIAYGRKVTKIRIDGVDFFVDNVRMASQNIPAEIIDKIQIIDDKSDQAKFSGFDDGQREQVLNITIKKKELHSYMGDGTLGGGTDGRFVANVRLFQFNEDRQLAVVAGANNANGNDVISGSNAGGPAVNQAQEAGTHFSSRLSPHLFVTGSYDFEGRRSVIPTITQQDYTSPDSAYTYLNNQQVTNALYAHSIQCFVGYGAGARDSFAFRPQLSYSINNTLTVDTFQFSGAQGNVTSVGNQVYAADAKAPQFTGSALWMHRFIQPGRTLSVWAAASPGPVVSNNDNFSIERVLSPPEATDTIWQVSRIQTGKEQYNVSASYTQRLQKNTAFELDYVFARNENVSGTSVYDVHTYGKVYDDSLSNRFDNVLTTHKLGLKFKYTHHTFNFLVGVGLQPTFLESRSMIDDTTRPFQIQTLQAVPITNLSWQLGKGRWLRIYYSGATEQPSVTQLQPVPDYSNPLSVAEGNPNLKPAFNNFFRFTYSDISPASGRSFFLNAFATVESNAIVNDVTVGAGGKQITQPVNVGGSYATNGSYDYALPLIGKNLLLHASGNLGFNHDISLLNGQENLGRNWNGRQSVRLNFNLGKWLELGSGMSYAVNMADYSLDTQKLPSVRTMDWSAFGRIDFLRSFSFRYNFDYTVNKGLPSAITQNVALLSAVLEERFFSDRAVLGLSVNNLLNNDASIAYNAQSGYQQFVRTNTLGRFFLLSCTWKFQHFQKGAQPKLPLY